MADAEHLKPRRNHEDDRGNYYEQRRIEESDKIICEL